MCVQFSTLRVDSRGGSELRWNYVLAWGIDNRASHDGGYIISAADIGLLRRRRSAGRHSQQPAVGAGTSVPTATHVAWPEFVDGQPDYTKLRPFPVPDDGGLPVAKAKSTSYGDYVLWRTAPVLCQKEGATDTGGGGFALLGESSKFISVSSQRIATISFDCTKEGVRVVLDLRGAPNESVAMAYVSDASIVSTHNNGTDTNAAASKQEVNQADCTLGANGKALLAITVASGAVSASSCGPSY